MSLEFSLRKLGLNYESKILNITHDFCFDGTTCSILMDNVFKNITIMRVNYNNIDSLIQSIIDKDYDKYDFIFITDISPNDPEIIKNKNKIILLDHHNTAKPNHNPLENKYVIDIKSGSTLVKMFLEKYFNKPLSHLNDLVRYSGDYDSWERKFVKSSFLNELHFKYFPNDFHKRFFSGNVRFKKDEIQYIRNQKNKFKKVYDELDLYEMNKINGVFINASEFLNELCSKLLEEKYDIVFSRNPKKNSISVRCKKDYVNIGEILKLFGGGGHELAGGITAKDLEDTRNKIEVIENYIFEELKRKKK